MELSAFNSLLGMVVSERERGTECYKWEGRRSMSCNGLKRHTVEWEEGKLAGPCCQRTDPERRWDDKLWLLSIQVADGAREQQGVSARDCAAVISLQASDCRFAGRPSGRGKWTSCSQTEAARAGDHLSSRSCRYYTFKIFQLNEPGLGAWGWAPLPKVNWLRAFPTSTSTPSNSLTRVGLTNWGLWPHPSQ